MAQHARLAWRIHMAGQRMTRKRTYAAMTAAMLIAGGAQSEDNQMNDLLISPTSGERILFTDFSHVIMGRSAGIPTVPQDSIIPFGKSFGVDTYYVGWRDAGQLFRMETWERIVTDPALPKGAILDDKPIQMWQLNPGEVYLFEATSPDRLVWKKVDPETLTGEVQFLRLRTLPRLSDGEPETVYEKVQQRLAEVATYQLDDVGALRRIIRATRENDFASQIIDMP